MTMEIQPQVPSELWFWKDRCKKVERDIEKLQAELGESNKRNKQCICLFCQKVLSRPDDDLETAKMLVDHAYECEQHPVAKLQAENDRLRDFVQSYADEPCEYGDNCPTFGNRTHYPCENCKAREALKG